MLLVDDPSSFIYLFIYLLSSFSSCQNQKGFVAGKFATQYLAQYVSFRGTDVVNCERSLHSFRNPSRIKPNPSGINIQPCATDYILITNLMH